MVSIISTLQAEFQIDLSNQTRKKLSQELVLGWHYRIGGTVHGPYSYATMCQWKKAGYFEDAGNIEFSQDKVTWSKTFMV